MPIYDFKCRECGKVSEVLIRGAEEPPRCPDCGSDDLERLMSSPNMVRTTTRAPGTTCCGRDERCGAPPCSTGDPC